jgi:hypothetical protein
MEGSIYSQHNQPRNITIRIRRTTFFRAGASLNRCARSQRGADPCPLESERPHAGGFASACNKVNLKKREVALCFTLPPATDTG